MTGSPMASAANAGNATSAAGVAPVPTREEEAQAFRKVTWRMLPIMALALFLNNLDRTNVGFAALTMNHDLGLTPAQFGIGASMLFITLSLFEIPSNLALVHFGARLWMARIMITWGLLSAGTALVSGATGFYVIRALLGVAEAGFFPGMILMFGNWFPVQYRTRVTSLFMIAAPISTMVSGPLSTAILPMNGFLGLEGWRWMFIIEGLPAVLLGVVLPFVISDRVQDAKWLTPREREVVAATLAAEKRDRPVHQFGRALADRRVLIMALIILGSLLGSYGLNIWMPLILKGQGFTNTQVGWLATGPYLIGCLTLYIWARLVDRSGKRVSNLAAACLLGAVGFAVSVFFPSFVFAYIGMFLAVMGITASRGLFWAIPPRILTGTAAAGAIAFINTVGTLGAGLGPVILGWMKNATGSFNGGLTVMAGLLFLSSALTLVLHRFMPAD